jgi:dienelactone hydrolase
MGLSRRSLGALTLLGCVTACDETPPAPTQRVEPSASQSPPRPARTGTAPAQAFKVSVKSARFNRGGNRPLRTLIWYPGTGGPFPLVLASHGLGGEPEDLADLGRKIAAAGFVVAAPAYPNTNARAKLQIGDLVNQPADASYVIGEVLKQNVRADPGRIAAAGHSGGGYTTCGLLSGSTRDTRLKAGIVLAGGQLNGDFSGPPAEMLFVHGDHDPTVPYATGRTAYAKVPWPKAFLTVLGADHASYLLGAGNTANTVVSKTMLDFLRYSLYGDAAAGDRLGSDASVSGVTSFETAL